MQTCCRLCTNISYLKPFKSIREASRLFFNSSAYSIMMPALATSSSNSYFGLPFVRFMKTPGVVYLRIDKSDDDFMEKAFLSIASTWPLFIIVILLTSQGGAIIWLLVCPIINIYVSSLSLNAMPRGTNWFRKQMTIVYFLSMLIGQNEQKCHPDIFVSSNNNDLLLIC